MCSAYLLVNLFIRILPMNCKYIKNVPTGKHGMLCSWHVTCNCFLFYLLRALAPGVHSITSLTPISNGGRTSLSLPYPFPRDEATEKCPDAGRVAPIRGCVWRLRFEVEL